MYNTYQVQWSIWPIFRTFTNQKRLLLCVMIFQLTFCIWLKDIHPEWHITWQSVQLFSAIIKRTQIHVKNSDVNRILPCFDCVRSVNLFQTRNRRGGDCLNLNLHHQIYYYNPSDLTLSRKIANWIWALTKIKKERHERSYPYPATKTIYDHGNLG